MTAGQSFRTIITPTIGGGLVGTGIGAIPLFRGYAAYKKRQKNATFKNYMKTPRAKNNRINMLAMGTAGILLGAQIGTRRVGEKTQEEVWESLRRSRARAHEYARAGGYASDYGKAREYARARAHEYAGNTKKAWDEYYMHGTGKTWDEFFRPKTNKAREGFLKIWGVNKNTIKTKDQIKKIFRNLAMKNHPDKGGADEKMKEITKAWGEIKGSEWFSKLAYVRTPVILRKKGERK